MKLARPIVITGFMGCGKTEVARALARRLHLEAIDLDDKIATQHGRTAAELILAEGEAAFRAIETSTLRELLNRSTANVIALGGGAWIGDENRALIAAHEGVAVLLDTPFEVCWQRIKASAQDRPLGRTRAQAEQLYHQRRPIYQLAHIHVAVMDHDDSLEKIVARIEAALANYRDAK
jgi:shikimate kinase